MARRALGPALALALAGACGDSRAPAAAPPPVAPAVRARLDELGARLGLRFEIDGSAGRAGGVRYEPAELEDVARYAGWLEEEWAEYPRCWIRTARLERVVFCAELRWETQSRAAVPDFEGGTMYFDVAYGAEHEAYVRRVMHHEFFHSFDRFDDGELWSDPAWSALNPPGFAYSGGGVSRQADPRTSLLETASTGFVDDYATSAVEEDKAELFALLMYEPAAVRERSANDPFLAAKWRRLTELVAAPCAGGEPVPLPSP